ncbi:hypothetical protein DFH09DRAFT_1125541 [Mycena vulgaris]|nr:hypothetical protein DFH09DRAFT_1125541 [Mycena vulgaris]
MRSHIALVFLLALKSVATSPVGPSLESRGDHQHVPFVKYPSEESTEHARRSSLVSIPFGEDFKETTRGLDDVASKDNTKYHPCKRDTVHFGRKPFIQYPSEE